MKFIITEYDEAGNPVQETPLKVYEVPTPESLAALLDKAQVEPGVEKE